MPKDFAPLQLTKNPFDPTYVNPLDLVTIPIGQKTGLDHLRAKLDEYETKLNTIKAEDFNNHSVGVMGPYQGGRTTFVRLVIEKLECRLKSLAIDPAKIFRSVSHPRVEMAQEMGPNAALKAILEDLLIKMEKDTVFGFDATEIDNAFQALSKAKELGDISSSFSLNMRKSLARRSHPLLLVFENLNSAGLYEPLRSTFFRFSTIIIVSAYSMSAASIDFAKLHKNDPASWWTQLDSLECEEIKALVEHNLSQDRGKELAGLFPFEVAAIDGFFNPPANKQPLGRIMRACYNSLELRATELGIDPAARRDISHDDMRQALLQT